MGHTAAVKPLYYTRFTFFIVRPKMIFYISVLFYSYFYVCRKISQIHIIIKWNITKELSLRLS